MNQDRLYDFVYRGLLTDASLDKAGRKTKATFGGPEAEMLRKALFFDLLDGERLTAAKRMAVVYTAIHAFENTVRDFVATALAEKYQADWWDKVPAKIRERVTTRMEQDSKFRWHGSRGGSQIEYCDFGDLTSIITVHWSVFEDVLVDLEWLKSTLSILERSRNIVMHGGVLALQDVERIGMNIRDWIRQAG